MNLNFQSRYIFLVLFGAAYSTLTSNGLFVGAPLRQQTDWNFLSEYPTVPGQPDADSKMVINGKSMCEKLSSEAKAAYEWLVQQYTRHVDLLAYDPHNQYWNQWFDDNEGSNDPLKIALNIYVKYNELTSRLARGVKNKATFQFYNKRETKRNARADKIRLVLSMGSLKECHGHLDFDANKVKKFFDDKYIEFQKVFEIHQYPQYRHLINDSF